MRPLLSQGQTLVKDIQPHTLDMPSAVRSRAPQVPPRPEIKNDLLPSAKPLTQALFVIWGGHQVAEPSARACPKLPHRRMTSAGEREEARID